MHTVPQILAGTKSETRRLGWKNVKQGELLQAIVKGQGLKKGETVQKLRVIRVACTWREKLRYITDFPKIGKHIVGREGFPGMAPVEFVDFFCRSHKGCTPETEVTVISFDYVAEVGDRVEAMNLHGHPWQGRVKRLTGRQITGDHECEIAGDEGQTAFLYQTALDGFKVLPREIGETKGKTL